MGGDPAERLPWIDTARAYGMVLVFYGHFVERLVDVGAGFAFPQFKLIYAFHMPFFFLMAGALVGPAPPGFARFLREKAAARLVPVVFFNALGLGVAVCLDFAFGSGPDPAVYEDLLRRLALGYPSFNFMTWFLICLFVVEVFHFAVSRALGRFAGSAGALAVSAAGFFAVGCLVTANLPALAKSTGLPPNFWYVHEAVVATGFYQLGIALRLRGALDASRPRRLALAAVTLVLTLSTFDANTGPFVFKQVVLMAVSGHGNVALFGFTAVAGSLFLIFAAQVTPPSRASAFVGGNTVVLLGINGLFFNFANGPLAVWLAPAVPDTPLATFALCAGVTLASLAASVPLVVALDRWLPQLVGRPRRKGPLLPRLAV